MSEHNMNPLESTITSIDLSDDGEQSLTGHEINAMAERLLSLPNAKVEDIAQAADSGNAAMQETPPEKIGIDVLDTFLEHVEKVTFGTNERGKIVQSTYYIDSIANLFATAEKHYWDIGVKNEIPHVFNGRFWQRIDTKTFRFFLQAVGRKQVIPYGVIKDHNFVGKLVKQFASEARFPLLSEDDTPKINLRNGTLYFTPNGVELRQFDKQNGLCYQLDYDYDEEAIAPHFKKYIERVLPVVGVRKLLFQYIGYVFLPKMNLEKILFLYGGGANGKSVFLNIIKALVGNEQCGAYTLEGLTKSEYQRAALGNYLLNVSTEISTRMGTSTFKQIASREPLPARSPYGKPFTVEDYATCIFAMNELPKDTEQTRAFFRRFLIIPFEVRIPEDEQDPNLAKIIIDSEMSGVLNYVIKGLKSLLTSGQFSIPSIVQEECEKFQRESDTVLAFLEENRYQPSSKYWNALREMYDFYKQQCSDDGSRAVSKRVFAKRLRDLGYEKGTHGRKKTTIIYAKQGDDKQADDAE